MGVARLAILAGGWRIRVFDGAQQFESLVAVLALVLVNGHGLAGYLLGWLGAKGESKGVKGNGCRNRHIE